MEKIVYKEIRYDDFKDYKWNGVQDKDRYTKFLFHGSRKGLIDESPEKIEAFHNECDAFMSYLKENIFQILSEMGFSREEMYKKLNRLPRVETYKNVKTFEYGDFYLTTDYLMAMSFSAYEAGELCDSCYQIALDIEKLGLVFKDERINELMETIIKKHEKYGGTEKVVLAIPDVLFDDMRSEAGGFYKDSIRKRLYEAKGSLGALRRMSVRLNNPSNYEFLLIHENEAEKFIPLFTDIKEEEVGKLRNSYMYVSIYNLFQPK